MPVVLHTPGWSPLLVQEQLGHGPHKLANDHLDFVHEEMANFVQKGFWTIMPYPHLVKRLGVYISRPSVVFPSMAGGPSSLPIFCSMV